MALYIDSPTLRLDDLDAEIKSLRTLATDLERICCGDFPSRDELRDAPRLDAWTIGTRHMPVLDGMTIGHPLLTGPSVKTSPLWAISQRLGWARTQSRWYRLGEMRIARADVN